MITTQSKILVTGGTGFFGSVLVRHLVEAGHSVRILSRGNHQPTHSQISMHKGDISNYQDVKLAIKDCSAIFHCAAEKNNPQKMVSANVEATSLLFNLAQELSVKFFCHLSSVGVIGKTDQKLVDETAPCNPMNLYEETKFAAEEIVKRGLKGGRVVILRPTNIFGPNSLSSFLSKSAFSRLRLFLKGNERSHLVYVEDVAAAATHLFCNLGPKNVESYIVSSDEEEGNTYAKVQSCLASINKSVSPPSFISAPIFAPYFMRLLKNRQANRGDIVYSSKKIRDFGFKFPYGLRQGLHHAFEVLP